MKLLRQLRELFRRVDSDAIEASIAAMPPADLDAAIGDEIPWTPEAQMAIRERLRLAAEREWATKALAAFDRNPDQFLRLYLTAVVDRATTQMALMRAAHQLRERAGTADIPGALRRLGIAEGAWLFDAGLTLDRAAPAAEED